MRRRLFVLFGSAALAGCSLLLGLEDKSPFPPNPGAASDGAGSDVNTASDTSPSDASGLDGSVDACAPAVADDPSSCGMPGTCGRDCRGGPCKAGRCGVVTLSTTKGDGGDAGATANPMAVAVVGELVFWATSEGDVFRCDRGDCGSTRQTLAKTGAADASYSVPTGVFSIAADETHVYWSQYYLSRFFRANHDGGGLAVRSANGAPSTLLLDKTSTYWTNFGAGSSAVWRCNKQDCFAADASAIFMSNPYRSATPPDALDCTEPENRCWFANSLTLNGTELTFSDDKPKPFGDILRIARDAVDAAVMPSGHAGFANPKAVTASEGAVYIAQYGDKDDAGLQLRGSIVRLQPNQVPTPLVLNEPQPESIVTDGESF